jgi:hypothetical protein
VTTEVDSRQSTVDSSIAGRRGIGTQRLQYEEGGSHSVIQSFSGPFGQTKRGMTLEPQESVILSERSESKNSPKLRATLQEQRSSNPRGTLRLTRRTRSLRVTCWGIGMARRKLAAGVAIRFKGPESVPIRVHPCPIHCDVFRLRPPGCAVTSCASAFSPPVRA